MSAGLAVVTGGATGIGAACCRALSEAGFRVGVHHCHSVDAAEELVASLPGAFPIRADLSEPAGADMVLDAVRGQQGDLRVLVNNAGRTLDAPLFRVRSEDIDSVTALNLRGTLLVTRRLARRMTRGGGRIVFMGSVVGATGNPGQAVYAMTKAAVTNLARTLAVELAPYGILVNVVSPGLVETAMTDALPEEVLDGLLERVPLGRLARPEEVADVVRFLCTGASYCTGAVFPVNGGMHVG